MTIWEMTSSTGGNMERKLGVVHDVVCANVIHHSTRKTKTIQLNTGIQTGGSTDSKKPIALIWELLGEYDGLRI